MIRVILHGRAAGDEALRKALKEARSEGVEIEIRVTRSEGDAERFASRAARQKIDTVVAAGGDGTLHEVVNGLLSSELRFVGSVGVIPLGTANDFATAAGVPDDPAEALRLILASQPFPIDLARVELPEGSTRFYINMATGG